MYILFSNKDVASSETRGNLLYKKYISNSNILKIIETSFWHRNFYNKILISLKILSIYFLNFKSKKYAICLKFTPLFIFFICRFLKVEIIYDCDDLIWSDNFFGKKKTSILFSLSSRIILENSFLKTNLLGNLNKFHKNLNIINCPLPEYKIEKKNLKKKKIFIPTYIYIGSKYSFSEVFPLLDLINSKKKLWNLTMLGSNIDKSKYNFLNDLICLPSYNSEKMCNYLDNSDIGIYHKASLDIDKGRGFHKKLIYLSRGLPILSKFSYERNLISNSHINLDDCWSEDIIQKKQEKLIHLEIIKNWNLNIKNKINKIFKIN